MKSFQIFFVLALLIAPLLGQRSTSADITEGAKEIRLRPSQGTLKQGQRLSLSFPENMASLEDVDATATDSPIIFTPALDATFTWNSRRTGLLTVTGSPKPGQSYQLDLRPGVTNASGKTWTPGVFVMDPLTVTSRFRAQDRALSALPEVDLSTNYEVAPAKVVTSVYFQSRKARQRIPAAILLPSIDTETPDENAKRPTTLSRFHVTPSRPLPSGDSFDLIIEGLTDAATNTAMPHLKAISLGSTQALEITEVETLSLPLDKPTVILNTTGPVDLESLTTESVSIEPAVENLSFFADNQAIRLKGDFASTATYSITLGDQVVSKTGFPLANPGPHQVTFDGLTPIIIFPRAQFYQRSALGLKMTVMLSNCPETTWRLARVPLERLHVVNDRLKEFEQADHDPFTGRFSGLLQTELLTDSLGLDVVATGKVAGTEKQGASYREIQWQAEDNKHLEGAYLLEASAHLADGRVLGNRSVLFFNELVIQRKLTGEDLLLKVFTMADGSPVAKAKVEVINRYNALQGEGMTDSTGALTLSRTLLEPAKKDGPAYIVVDSDLGRSIQPYRGARFIGSGYASRKPDPSLAKKTKLLGDAFADRSLYRPGDSVYVKGTVRQQGAEGLSLPKGRVSWQIQEGWSGPEVASGEATLDAFGGWEALWATPETAKLSDYRLTAKLDSQDVSNFSFRIEEYKPPLFNITFSETDDDHLLVSSHYFHGAPNAGAKLRWTAHWTPRTLWGGDETDRHSPQKREPISSVQRHGEAQLDANGQARLPLTLPYEKPLTYGRYEVYFQAEVLSPEGQVIEHGKSMPVHPHEHFAVIQWTRAADDTPGDRDLLATVHAFDREDKPQPGLPVDLTIYHVETQTVKERLGVNVYRYRNYPRYHLLKKVTIKSKESYRFTPERTGHYVAYAKLVDDPSAPGVSTTIHSVGDGVGRYDVYNDGEITLQLDKEHYVAGADTAQIALEAPFGGQAWVTVETDSVLDQFLVDIPANNQTIALPIKPSYHPNVNVSVYLLHPGGEDRLPRERYGTKSIVVKRPDLHLGVTSNLSSSDVQPGDMVKGTVSVLCQDLAVLGADVTVFAVDDSVHQLGYWQLPNWFSQMYPQRYHRVASYRGLDDHFEKFEEREVTEKGFIIGGGAEDGFGPTDSGSEAALNFRGDFRALAFWEADLQTNAQGIASFEFQAPDNLTSYHLVAVAQTKAHQFGQGESSFKVSKRLMVEPALTRFVRRGDVVELRAVVRQNYLDNTSVTVRCEVEGQIEWLETSQEQQVGLTKGLPQVLRFPCRVLGGDAIKVRFQAQSVDDVSLADAVEIPLPVALPGILEKSGHYGIIAKEEASFPLNGNVPELWQQSSGSYKLTLSHTPYLPELDSLPEVLDYPHGCFEQKSTRYLSYVTMLDLLDYLPEVGHRHTNYRERLAEGLVEYDNALLASGFMPYWAGAEEANPWVTVMAYWLSMAARAEGIEVPSKLQAGLDQAFTNIVHGRDGGQTVSIPLATRAFALFVHAETGQAVSGMEALLADLYSRRGNLSLDALSLLTLAMNKYDVMPQEQKQLTEVLEKEIQTRDRAFNHLTFGSLHRDRALRWLSKVRLASDKERRHLSDVFLKECEDEGKVSLSTQEHFWKSLLLAEFVSLEKASTFSKDTLAPAPDFVSQNLASIAWRTQPLEHLQDLNLKLGKGKSDRHYFMRAEVLREGDLTAPEDRGIRLERIVRNLTEASRIGTEESPYQIGDELLLSYQFETAKHQYYVALIDELPAGIETVNFNLPQVAQVYQLPKEASATLPLSHSELRDQSANLYFNHVAPGPQNYSILARVTAAGSFTWPSAQISPMYQPHIGGLTASSKAHSRGDR